MNRNVFASNVCIVRDMSIYWFENKCFDSWEELKTRGKWLISKGYNKVLCADEFAPHLMAMGWLFEEPNAYESYHLTIKLRDVGSQFSQEEKALIQSEMGKLQLAKVFYE